MRCQNYYARPRFPRGTVARRSQAELLQAAAARPEFEHSAAKTKARFPRLKLAPSPFAAGKE